MLNDELIAKIRRIDITTRKLVTDGFAGEYQSVFKGRGMEFDEVRQYHPGDDVRMIDWNVTARTGDAYVKSYIEERELTVMLVVDASRSGDFGTRSRFKRELAAELAAVLAFSATTNNDRVGLLVFTDRVELLVPPRKGRSHVLRMVRDLLVFEPDGTGTDVRLALETVSLLLKRRSIVFLISDFLTAPGVIPAGHAADGKATRPCGLRPAGPVGARDARRGHHSPGGRRDRRPALGRHGKQDLEARVLGESGPD